MKLPPPGFKQPIPDPSDELLEWEEKAREWMDRYQTELLLHANAYILLLGKDDK